MINNVIIIGRLTKDAELRKANTGTSVVSFTIAVDNPTKDSNGNKTTSFIPCTVWKEQADNLVKYTHKGSLIGIQGRLNQRSYDGNDGSKKYVIEVVCSTIQFLESKSDPNTNANPTPVPQPKPNVVANPSANANISQDDLPF